VRVELSAEAQAAVERIDRWWRANRPAAPALFLDELDRALAALEDSPGLGVRYPSKPGVRRLLLLRSSHHVYFVEQADRVFVLSVWSASRGRGPDL
jgi:plasmid stabilization system protein ParE